MIAKVEYTGTWTSATATSGYYGSDYRWAATSRAPPRRRSRSSSPRRRAGTIDAWWVSGGNRSTAASFIAYDSAGIEVGRVSKNQQASGGQWNTLGTFAFKAGWNRVVLSRWQAPGSVVVADAVRVR